MKCDELCVYKDCEDFQTFDRHFTEAYKKSEVDDAITELKELLEDACLERDDNQKVIDELRTETRDSNHEMWLAKAECAKYKSDYFFLVGRFDDSAACAEEERKCRGKSEEYK